MRVPSMRRRPPQMSGELISNVPISVLITSITPAQILNRHPDHVKIMSERSTAFVNLPLILCDTFFLLGLLVETLTNGTTQAEFAEPPLPYLNQNRIAKIR